MDNRKLQKEDILINSTGVGTAGRVTYFALDDNYAVDSHITILRLDKSIALSKFILYCLGHIGFDNIEKMAKGQSGQIELSLEIIKNIKVPIPSINSQLKMINYIEGFERQKENLLDSIKKVNKEKNSILYTFL